MKKFLEIISMKTEIRWIMKCGMEEEKAERQTLTALIWVKFQARAPNSGFRGIWIKKWLGYHFAPSLFKSSHLKTGSWIRVGFLEQQNGKYALVWLKQFDWSHQSGVTLRKRGSKSRASLAGGPRLWQY